MPLILSVIMTCIVSCVSILRTTGIHPGFIKLWAGAWGMSWLIAFPALLVFMPLVRRLVGRLVEPVR